MNDIYDIKDTLLWLPINITNSLIFIVFIIVLFFILKYLLKKEEKIEEIQEEVVEKAEVKDYIDILKEFEENYMYSQSEVFYSKLLEIVREILDEKENKSISKMTFEEINNLNIDNLIKNLIKEIYFKEYMEYVTHDNHEYRKELIEKVLLIIKN